MANFNDSINGVDSYVLSSGLQKEVRRGNTEMALRYAFSLIIRGFAKHVVKRLFVYIVEDIGLANVNLWEQFIKLINNIDYYKNINHNYYCDFWLIYETIFLLCNSAKNREIDNCIICNLKQLTTEDNEFFEFVRSDFSFTHQLKRNYYQMYNNEGLFWIKDKLLSYLSQYFTNVPVNILNNYLKMISFIKSNHGWNELFLYFTFFYLFNKYHNQIQVYNIDWDMYYMEYMPSFSAKDRFELISSKDVKDYVYDKHTAKGKSMWRWLKFFFEVWAKLNNETAINGDKYKSMIMDNLDKIC